MTNSLEIFNLFHGKFCTGDHQHQVISGSEGGMKRSQAAQCYPEPMIRALCEGLLTEGSKARKDFH